MQNPWNWLETLIANKIKFGDDHAEQVIMRVIGMVGADDPDRKRLEAAYPRLKTAWPKAIERQRSIIR
jgi:hypothetical protein